MCAIHGKWIDDNPSIATVEKLRQWKSDHEREISAWVEHGHPGIFKSWGRLAALTSDQLETIKTSLPNGQRIVRDDAALVAALAEPGFCLVNGDSGVGKSAMVRTALDTHFPEARQIWLGPAALQAALSEVDREGLGLSAPLLDLLMTTSAPQNFLVLDAVERAGSATVHRLAELVRKLNVAAEAARNWRVIAISQRAGFEVHLDPLNNGLARSVITVPPIGLADVRAVLLSEPALAQHANDNAFVALLSNLRTLAWIVGAGSLFSGRVPGQMAGRPHIADRLWSHWTNGDPDLHSFMIALARRDADYERSFALSELEAADRAAWKAGRQTLPLVLGDRNRLRFEHDLASDWARYQYLKEISGDVPRWAALANQPLWVAALQILGQFLLLERDQATQGWDWAFAAAEAASATDAVDVLLDALSLDPAADTYLAARTELLFADNGKLLDRLLARFMHIATVPQHWAVVSAEDPGVALYAEAEMRTPLWSLWPPLIRFLADHRAAIAPFASRTVAKLCEMWLTKAPVRVDGKPVIGREELAELAVETARVDQIRSIAYPFYGGRSDDAVDMFAAALAGAEDAPEVVSAFALELARRRPLAETSQAQVDALRAEERKRRDEQPRARTKAPPPPMSLSMFGHRKLPPWPLGPAGRLNEAFRTSVLRNSALGPLMKAAPEVAAEVLLACIVDDKPIAEPSQMALDPRLGLHWEHDDRPTIFWTSPFFPFLAQAPEAALGALLSLVEFSTERWAEDIDQEETPSIGLVLNDGSARTYVGDWQVLDWSHMRRAVNSQLFAALDGLERWLWMKIDAGEDVGSLCSNLLARAHSVAVLGVLANCAKLQPALLHGALAPLLTSPFLLVWDEYRLSRRLGSDAFAWYRAGETARAIGLEWEQAAHRSASLRFVIRDARRADPTFDERARQVFDAWPDAPNDLRLRLRALKAELDPVNWYEQPGKDGAPIMAFRYPPDLAAEIEANQPARDETVTLAMVLRQLEQMFGSPLNAAEAADLYAGMDDQEDLGQFSPGEQRIIRTAVAAILLARGGDWLDSDETIIERLSEAIERCVPAPDELQDLLDGRIDHGPGLVWAVIGAVFAKALQRDHVERWDRILSTGLASGDIGIIRTVIAAARSLRDRLGASYFAIVEASVFGATLSALTPRMESEPGSATAMARWRRRLALRPLAHSVCPADFDLVALAGRVERLWLSRFRRSTGQDLDIESRQRLHKRYSFGISSRLLIATFDWALQEDVPPVAEERDEHWATLRMIWDFVEWQLRDHPYKPLGDYEGFDRLDDFGLMVIRTIAARIPLGSAVESRILWEPVLALGPRGEFTVEHMIDCFFLRLYKDADGPSFNANWDAMLAFVFTPGWIDGGRSWRARSILQRMLGLNAAHQIANNPAALAHVKDLAPYFEAFARNHIPYDDGTLASFASFIASGAGVELRLDAIQWIEKAISEDPAALKKNAGSALADLTRVLLAEHGAALVADRAARHALNNVIGRMVRDQAPYALALQDRARTLR